MSRFRDLLIGTSVLVAMPLLTMAEPLGLGRPALPEEIAAWDVKVMPDGRGLPEGQGNAADGEFIFSDNCAACHGEFAEGVDNWPQLAGGFDTLDRADPVKTVGSYWPYLSTVWDYIHRSMPYGNAQTLSVDDTYAIVAYILYSNDLVDDDFVLSRDSFGEVGMPNVDGFIVDDRDDVELAKFIREPCMEDCKDSVEITMRAANLDVTPDDTSDNPPGEAAPAMMLEGGGGTVTPATSVGGAEGAPKEVPAEGAEAIEAEAAAEATSAETASPAAEAQPVPVPAPEGADLQAGDAAKADEATDNVAKADPHNEAAAAHAADPALIAAGKKVFAKCSACHMVGDGAKNRVGPILNGVVDRAAGTVDGFKYSGAMAEAGESGLAWTASNLHGYLADPKGFLPGNKMTFAGLKKPQDVEALIAYLASHP